MCWRLLCCVCLWAGLSATFFSYKPEGESGTALREGEIPLLSEGCGISLVNKLGANVRPPPRMQNSLEQIYDAHADALYAFLLNCSRDQTRVQDALQDVFLKLARTPSLVRDARDLRGFLLRIAHNALRDLVRRSSTRAAYEEKHSEELPLLSLPVFPADDEAFRNAVAQALQCIPAQQRAVLHLKLWENFTFAQISETLEISPNTAASRYRYALDKLRDVLRPVYEERL